MSLFNIADLNSPALLFVGREDRGRESLTIFPIGHIVTLSVRVTRQPNAPVSTYFASASSTVRAKVVPEAKIQCPTRDHIPLKEKPRPMSQDPARELEAKSQCLHGKTARARISGRQIHQDNAQSPRVQARRDHRPTGVEPDPGN